jgi:fumarate hydratase class II
MPREITHAFGILKKAAAIANHRISPTAWTTNAFRRSVRRATK